MSEWLYQLFSLVGSNLSDEHGTARRQPILVPVGVIIKRGIFFI